jgi:hypothetical protein
MDPRSFGPKTAEASHLASLASVSKHLDSPLRIHHTGSDKLKSHPRLELSGHTQKLATAQTTLGVFCCVSCFPRFDSKEVTTM